MIQEQDKQSTDRRRTADIKSRLFMFFSWFAWVVLLVSLIFFHYAQPEYETVFDRFYQLNLRTSRDYEALKYLTVTIISGCTVLVLSILLGRIRARRQTDHIHHLFMLGFCWLVLIGLALLLR